MPTIEQPYDKIDIFGDSLIVVGTGAVGLGQRFCQIVEDLQKRNSLLKGTPIDVGKTLSQAAINDFRSTGAPVGQYASMVAFPLNGRAHLVEFDAATFQPELKTEKIWFTSLGCVQTITDSFLAFLKSVFWRDEQPNISDGIFAVKWTLDHAVEVNPGGVNKPVCLAVLQQVGGKFTARRIPDEELEEHEQNIIDAKTALVEFRDHHRIEVHPEIPTVQKPITSEGLSSVVSTKTPSIENLVEQLNLARPPLKTVQDSPQVQRLDGNDRDKKRKRH